MLDTVTKRRIDTARDILVGKVPDPKSQVEQITIALIYKFMDDMDAESEEFGGQRTFFAGEFARYGWAKLMRSGLGGYETLNLYAEAIAKMPENPGIPLLFRDIFKNAYLPYRDPETLKMFLKVIDEFTYDHSEKLGDAFEYLLSVLGSQGDAGQFRTPRHIIDFMVEIIDPKKNETVLDPACGTGGFLISSYKHIRKANTDDKGNSTLTPDEKGRLAQNFKGYDISPDMVRLSLVNMYLHGFVDPHIAEYDTLTSQEKWNEYADVIMANPPFMSPKGGIKPHNRFTVQSRRSEVLFVDYMLEHLTPNGRAGIIVPEGIIFQSGTAYKRLREALLKEALIGVISLPSGVFQPYSGVKTSILILDKRIAKSRATVIFSDVRTIGISLGIKRTVTETNDLPYVLKDYAAYYNYKPVSAHSWQVERSAILANECNLSGERYRPAEIRAVTRSVRLKEVCSLIKGTHSSTKSEPGPYPLIVTAEEWLNSFDYQMEGETVCVPLISSTGHGRASIKRIHFATGKFAVANLLAALQPKDLEIINAKFLYLVLDLQKDKMASLMRGAANVSMKIEDLAEFRIPLPPLEVQKEIVAEIEGYQKVINGARAVVDNYRPHIHIDPEWPMVELSNACETIMDGTHFSPSNTETGEHLYITSKNVRENCLDLSNVSYVSSEDHKSIYSRCPVKTGDVLYVKDGANTGLAAINTLTEEFSLLSSVAVFRGKPDLLDNRYLVLFLNSDIGRQKMLSMISGVAITRLTLTKLNSALMPLPPLAKQQSIVAEIEAEQKLVAANRELIKRFEKKIQATLARVWGRGQKYRRSRLIHPAYTVVGIDVGEEPKGFHAVAIRDGAFIVKPANRDPAEIVDWCLAQRASVVAVDAPCRWSEAGKSRLAERELRLFGKQIRCFATPTRERARDNKKGFYDWILNGERLYRLLENNYQLFKGKRQKGPECFETFPQAVACAMAGGVVSAKHKATIRRLALQKRGYDISHLSNIDFVDAALCAVAADQFSKDNHQPFGNSEEGFIVVPKPQ